jgi:hypothetical protein
MEPECVHKIPPLFLIEADESNPHLSNQPTKLTN